MSAKTKTRPERSGQDLSRQPNRFAGLYLTPFAGLLTAWLIHVYVRGIDLHVRSLRWKVDGSLAGLVVVSCLLTLVSAGLAVTAWHFTRHRERPQQVALAGSAFGLGALFAINVGVGPHRVWSAVFIIAGWIVATIWSMARLDVARNDKTDEGPKDDGFLAKIGLKGWRPRKVTPNLNDRGEHISTTVQMQHAEGDVLSQLQDAVPNIESAAAAPAGLSRAVGTDRADRSEVTVMHADPLKDPTRLPEPTAPGGSITDPAGQRTGTYSTGAPVLCWIGGSASFAPSSYLFMGMTRTGKTTTENQLLTEVITRRDVVILYLNRAKGMQDARPIISGIEAAVLASDETQGALYREAFKQVKAIMAYRSNILGLFGVDAWNADCYAAPPWRTDETGRRVQMEPMPALIVHVGEADDILTEDRGESTFLASKGLSLGVITGWSMQRADYRQMPTGLRFNLGTAWCFGCGDADSAEFALTKHVIQAGAHPDKWGQTKPGYFYFQGLGVDDAMYPVHARSAGLGPDGEKITEALLRRTLEWGPRMAKLDAGSVAATGGWWEKTVAETDRLRGELLGTRSATIPQVAAPAGPQVAAPAGTADEDEVREVRAEMEEQMRETTHVEDVELYPELDGGRASLADATAALQTGSSESFSWEDERPAPRDREAAIKALRQALLELTTDETLMDSSGAIILNPGLILGRYPFRSRPFFSAALCDMGNGDIAGPAGWVLSPAPDLGLGKGKYRLTRIPDGDR